MQSALPADQSAGTPYLHLSERAVAYIRERGGSVAEDALIGFVFGASGPATLWQPLLRQILSSDERVLLRPDGRWSLANLAPPTGSGSLSDFVSIDVETTGLHPVRQRVIEIALIRYTAGEITERYSTLVNPDKRIPKFIATLTGITNAEVEDAPRFAEIAADVEAFLDGALLVGHNVGFDINFINAELGRANRPQLINERLDVMGLASRLIPGLRRPSLDKVAAHLGFSPRKIHRAEIDAELAGTVALHLAVRAQDLGIDTVDRLRAIGRPAVHTPSDGLSRGRSMLDRSLLADIPKRPGVYLMRDVNGRIIYVGKAKNLRDRVSSYFSQPLGYTRKMDGLLESIAKIDVEETGSELAALLLESQLIRRYQPRYNVVMRASEEYPYIRVDLANPWPRITLTKSRKDDGAVYFGPFKSRRSVKTAVDLVGNHYPLRTCSRSFKTPKSYGSPCIQLDLGKCLGPCVGRADRDEYMRNVREVVAFLGGQNEVMFERLHEQLEMSAEDLDFERARKLRNSINLLQSLIRAHGLIQQADEQVTTLVVQPGIEPGTRNAMLVVRGRLWGSFTFRSVTSELDLSERLERSWLRYREHELPEIDHHSLDDVTILSRWIKKAGAAPCLLRVTDESDPDWRTLARNAIALSDRDMELRIDDDILLETADEPAITQIAGDDAELHIGDDLVASAVNM